MDALKPPSPPTAAHEPLPIAPSYAHVAVRVAIPVIATAGAIYLARVSAVAISIVFVGTGIAGIIAAGPCRWESRERAGLTAIIGISILGSCAVAIGGLDGIKQLRQTSQLLGSPGGLEAALTGLFKLQVSCAFLHAGIHCLRRSDELYRSTEFRAEGGTMDRILRVRRINRDRNPIFAAAAAGARVLMLIDPSLATYFSTFRGSDLRTMAQVFGAPPDNQALEDLKELVDIFSALGEQSLERKNVCARAGQHIVELDQAELADFIRSQPTFINAILLSGYLDRKALTALRNEVRAIIVKYGVVLLEDRIGQNGKKTQQFSLRSLEELQPDWLPRLQGLVARLEEKDATAYTDYQEIVSEIRERQRHWEICTALLRGFIQPNPNGGERSPVVDLLTLLGTGASTNPSFQKFRGMGERLAALQPPVEEEQETVDFLYAQVGAFRNAKAFTQWIQDYLGIDGNPDTFSDTLERLGINTVAKMKAAGVLPEDEAFDPVVVGKKIFELRAQNMRAVPDSGEVRAVEPIDARVARTFYRIIPVLTVMMRVAVCPRSAAVGFAGGLALLATGLQPFARPPVNASARELFEYMQRGYLYCENDTAARRREVFVAGSVYRRHWIVFEDLFFSPCLGYSMLPGGTYLYYAPLAPLHTVADRCTGLLQGFRLAQETMQLMAKARTWLLVQADSTRADASLAR